MTGLGLRELDTPTSAKFVVMILPARPFLPNKPDSANPAMTLQFQSESQWRRVADLGRWLRYMPLSEITMKAIKQTTVILGLCLLAAITGRGQDLVAVFKIANSPRPLLFHFHPPSPR